MGKNDIKDLMSYIQKLGLSEVYIKTKDIEIRISGPLGKKNVPPDLNLLNDLQSAEAEPTENYVEIKSPMVGTFYRAPNPETDPFVKEGTEVKKGDPLCIIEAMKLFNEFNAEQPGKIVKILVQDGTPVEYGQPLFLIEPY